MGVKKSLQNDNSSAMSWCLLMFLQGWAVALALLFPWLTAFLLNIFPVLEVGVKFIAFGAAGCVPIPTTAGSGTVPLVLSVVGYYVPAVTMGLGYGVVLVKTWQDVRRRPVSRIRQRRLDISRTLFLQFLWQCATVVPATVVSSAFTRELGASLPMQLSLRTWGVLRNVFNPVCHRKVKFFQSKKSFNHLIGVCRRRYPPSSSYPDEMVERFL